MARTGYLEEKTPFAENRPELPPAARTALAGTWCSDVSNGNHSFYNIRAFLFGSAGGFFKTGQHTS